MRAKRTDKGQRSIVADLRDSGCQVIIINDFIDLLVGCPWGWLLMEVKEPDGDLDRALLRFIGSSRGPVAVVTNINEALITCQRGGLSRSQQDAILGWLVKNPKQETLSVKKFFKLINGDVK